MFKFIKISRLRFLFVLIIFVKPDLLYASEDLQGISASTLAVVVNLNDPDSRQIARYYQLQRGIPDENIIRVLFDTQSNIMSAKEFSRVQAQIDTQLPKHIRGFALTWSKPYRVACMSMTSAFALGFDRAYCAKGCKATWPVTYNRESVNIRPAMMLAGATFTDVRELIDRGIAADNTHPKGTAYFLSTSDKRRNVRSIFFQDIQKKLGELRHVSILRQDSLSDRDDILFYFTGLKRVEELNSNRFVPGAVADHLTSAGGRLFSNGQMSILRWLEAGATASYGTVVEPCNILGKFPNPGLLMANYYNGDTVIEAYWKSVKMPGQGLFVGEPLAAPFKSCRVVLSENGVFHFINRDASETGVEGQQCL